MSTDMSTGASTGTAAAAESPAAPATPAGAAAAAGHRASRRWVRLWVPNHHGAWAMLLLPLVVGAIRGDLGLAHAWLLLAWLLAYLAYWATSVWLRSRLRARYRPPVLAYAAAAAAVGGPLLLAEPDLVRWGVVYAPLLAASLAFSARRAERAFVNDVLTVAAAALMAVVAYGLGRPDDGAWLPGAGLAPGWMLAAACFAYFVGTALYVKTMIRNRGSRAMFAASVVYHVAVAAVFAWWLPWVGGFLALMAVRACLVPRHWPSARPSAIGVGEVVASVVLAVVLTVAPL